jgi:hypothetical protein
VVERQQELLEFDNIPPPQEANERARTCLRTILSFLTESVQKPLCLSPAVTSFDARDVRRDDEGLATASGLEVDSIVVSSRHDAGDKQDVEARVSVKALSIR